MGRLLSLFAFLVLLLVRLQLLVPLALLVPPQLLVPLQELTLVSEMLLLPLGLPLLADHLYVLACLQDGSNYSNALHHMLHHQQMLRTSLA